MAHRLVALARQVVEVGARCAPAPPRARSAASRSISRSRRRSLSASLAAVQLVAQVAHARPRPWRPRPATRSRAQQRLRQQPLRTRRAPRRSSPRRARPSPARAPGRRRSRSCRSWWSRSRRAHSASAAASALAQRGQAACALSDHAGLARPRLGRAPRTTVRGQLGQALGLPARARPRRPPAPARSRPGAPRPRRAPPRPGALGVEHGRLARERASAPPSATVRSWRTATSSFSAPWIRSARPSRLRAAASARGRARPPARRGRRRSSASSCSWPDAPASRISRRGASRPFTAAAALDHRAAQRLAGQRHAGIAGPWRASTSSASSSVSTTKRVRAATARMAVRVRARSRGRSRRAGPCAFGSCCATSRRQVHSAARARGGEGQERRRGRRRTPRR